MNVWELYSIECALIHRMKTMIFDAFRENRGDQIDTTTKKIKK